MLTYLYLTIKIRSSRPFFVPLGALLNGTPCKDAENSVTTKIMSEKNAEISARIGEVVRILGETPNSFALRLGYKRAQTLYDILNGKSAPSYDFFRKFALSEYSETISLMWLLTGKGEPTFNSSKTEDLQSYEGQPQPYLIEKIAEQAEEIGRLKARIEELERRRGPLYQVRPLQILPMSVNSITP